MTRLRRRIASETSLRHLKNRLNVCTLPNDDICFSAQCGVQTVPMGNTDYSPDIDVNEQAYIGDHLSELEFSSTTVIQTRS
jgi:hypothetical protein